MHQTESGQSNVRVDDDIAILEDEEQHQQRVQWKHDLDDQQRHVGALRIFSKVNEMIRECQH